MFASGTTSMIDDRGN